jgi:hypothetical protein
MNKPTLVPIAILIGVCFGLFFLTQPQFGFLGADAYYHAKHALLYENGIYKAAAQFPWIKFTILRDSPADLWWGFHLLLFPFVKLFGLFFGLKLALTLLVTTIVLVFLYLLKKLKVIFPYLWIAVLLSGSFYFLIRLNLPRPHLLAIILSLLAFYAIVKTKHFMLLLIGFFWTIMEPTSIFLLGMSGLFFLIPSTASLRKKISLFIMAVLGISIGLVLHPAFPNNLAFSGNIINIIIFRLFNIDLNIGTELYPYSLPRLIEVNFLILPLWLAALAVYSWNWWIFRQKPKAHTANKNNLAPSLYQNRFSLLYPALLSLAFFIVTLFFQRFTEYWVPFATLFSALIFTPYLKKIPWPDIKKRFRKEYLIFGPISLVILSIAFILAFNTVFVYQFTKQAAEKTYSFQGASQYAAANSPKEALVFNTTWDQFPQLFFWNNHNSYVVVICPSLMYFLNQKQYWLWRHISEDEHLSCAKESCLNSLKQARRIEDVIKNEFGASFVFLENDRTPNLNHYLAQKTKFKKVYSDQYTTLYQIQ